MSILKILIVEDEKIIAQEISLILESLGYEIIDVADNGERAIKKAKSKSPDLVLMDIRLKGEIDGIEAAAEIYQKYNIPVVYLTAYSDDETLKRAKITEPFGYILKPFNRRELQAIIEIAVYKNRAESKLKEREAYYRALFEHSNDAIFLMDYTGNLYDANQRAIEMLDYKKDQLFSMKLFALSADSDNFDFESLLHKVINNGSVALESRFQRSNGDLIDVDLNARVVKVNRETIQVVIRDITRRKQIERELLVNQRLLNQAEEISNSGSFEWNLENRTVRWSDGFYQLVGHEKEQKNQAPYLLFKAIHPEDRLRFKTDCRAIQRNKQINFPRKYRIINSNGSVRMLYGTATYLIDSEGNISRMIGVMQDITEQHETEEALREREERYRQLFQESPVSLWEEDLSGFKKMVLDLNKDGVTDLCKYAQKDPQILQQLINKIHILDVNYRTLKLFDAKNIKELREKLQIIYGKESDVELNEIFQSILENKSQFEMDTVRQTVHGEKKYVRLKWVAASGCEESLTKVLVSILDISDWKHAEFALKTSEERFRRIFQYSPIGMVLIDTEYRIYDVNKEFCKMLGFEESELKGIPLEQLIHPEDNIITKKLLDKVFNKVISYYHIQNRFLDLNKNTVWGNVSTTIIQTPDDKRIFGLVIVQNITKNKKAEAARDEAEQKLKEQRVLSMHSDRLRSLGEMAAGIAHELYQPLAGVRGQAEHLLIGHDKGWTFSDDDYRENLQEILNQADRMNHIIEHIRVFSREAGKQDKQLVETNDVVLSALKMLRAQLHSRSINLEVNLCKESLPIFVNPYSLEEVIINILTNARDAVEEQIKYSSSVEGHIGIKTSINEDKESVLLTIKDNGTGIPTDIITKIFDPFFTTKEPDKGTGLGLAISKSIIEQFEGQITIQSESGKGSTIAISLPLYNAREEL